tara:strand:+ start:179 stop:1114 length:936 start_codon:yes stop_codon:yes gene_type:complete
MFLMSKIDIEMTAEFASDVVLGIPYAYWLHKQGKLGKLKVCKGMKPFYYFADDVEEVFNERSLDNSVGLKDVPNKWLHNSEAGDRRNGVIDYSEWECPPFREHYKNNIFDDLKPFVVVNNIFNIEPGDGGFRPYRYFDIKNLCEIFSYLINKGYNVVYKRPDNSEFTLDQNEEFTNRHDVTSKLKGEIDGHGLVNDWELCGLIENVHLINDLVDKHNMDYSTFNLKLFAETEGFVTINGGGSQFCACFGKPMVIYTTKGPELRPGYLEQDDSYIKMLSKADIYPVFDFWEEHEKNGGRNYDLLNKTIAKVF